MILGNLHSGWASTRMDGIVTNCSGGLLVLALRISIYAMNVTLRAENQMYDEGRESILGLRTLGETQFR